MDKIKKIEFVLENCEVLYIEDLSCLEHIYVGKMYTTAVVEGGLDEIKFSGTEFTDYLRLYFNSKFKDALQTSHHFMEDRTPYDRLMIRDVTSIVFIFEDDSEKQLYVPWVGIGFGPNKAMTIKSFPGYENETMYIIMFNEQSSMCQLVNNVKNKLHTFLEKQWFKRQRNIARKIAEGKIIRKCKDAK